METFAATSLILSRGMEERSPISTSLASLLCLASLSADRPHLNSHGGWRVLKRHTHSELQLTCNATGCCGNDTHWAGNISSLPSCSSDHSLCNYKQNVDLWNNKSNPPWCLISARSCGVGLVMVLMRVGPAKIKTSSCYCQSWWPVTSPRSDLEALLLTMEVATGNLRWTLSRPTPNPTAGGPKKCWNTAPVWCRAVQARIRLPEDNDR